jgi:hypothetical protein
MTKPARIRARIMGPGRLLLAPITMSRSRSDSFVYEISGLIEIARKIHAGPSSPNSRAATVFSYFPLSVPSGRGGINLLRE